MLLLRLSSRPADRPCRAAAVAIRPRRPTACPRLPPVSRPGICCRCLRV